MSDVRGKETAGSKVRGQEAAERTCVLEVRRHHVGMSEIKSQEAAEG